MEKILNILNCCSREDIHKKSEINIQGDNSTENNQSTINNKTYEKDKASELKSESLIIKQTEGNITNENKNNKKEENKKVKINTKNKENQKNNKKSKSKNKHNKEIIAKKDETMTVEDQNKILSNIFKYRSSSRKDIRPSIIHKDSVITLNDLALTLKNTDEIHENGSKLLISGELLFYKEIIIQTYGLKNTRRKQSDDHVYFGLKNQKNPSSCFHYNDIIINYVPCEETESVETTTGRVFEIFYNKTSKDYTLKFLHPNLILYYKINNYVYFNTGKEYYLLLGNVFITINVIKNSPMEKAIVIQIENENNNYTFNQNQTPIKIGRTNNNDLPIYSQSISKRHGIIEFSNNIQSFYYRDLGSTNSSTLLIKENDNLKIKGIMNFKLEDTPFRIQEIP
jgi:hypothetical protein